MRSIGHTAFSSFTQSAIFNILNACVAVYQLWFRINWLEPFVGGFSLTSVYWRDHSEEGWERNYHWLIQIRFKCEMKLKEDRLGNARYFPAHHVVRDWKMFDLAHVSFRYGLVQLIWKSSVHISLLYDSNQISVIPSYQVCRPRKYCCLTVFLLRSWLRGYLLYVTSFFYLSTYLVCINSFLNSLASKGYWGPEGIYQWILEDKSDQSSL